MSNNQTNPYMNLGQINPSQIPPALYQQFLQQQQQNQQPQPQQFQQMMNNNGQPPPQMGFNGLHQTYQRLQSQESAKLDQQRLGMGMPGTAPSGQYHQLLALQSQGGNPSPNINGMMGNQGYQPQQQQMPQQQQQPMPQLQQQQPNMNLGQAINQNGGNIAQLNMAQIQQILQQQQNSQQQQHQGGMNQGTNALGMGGMNPHSQSQGLNLTAGMSESEQGRRQQALQRQVKSYDFVFLTDPQYAGDSRHAPAGKPISQPPTTSVQPFPQYTDKSAWCPATESQCDHQSRHDCSAARTMVPDEPGGERKSRSSAHSAHVASQAEWGCCQYGIVVIWATAAATTAAATTAPSCRVEWLQPSSPRPGSATTTAPTSNVESVGPADAPAATAIYAPAAAANASIRLVQHCRTAKHAVPQPCRGYTEADRSSKP